MDHQKTHTALPSSPFGLGATAAVAVNAQHVAHVRLDGWCRNKCATLRAFRKSADQEPPLY